jgi:small subunit ribosomal protein S21
MLKVKVKKKNIEAALKEYKYKVYKTKQLENIRDGEYYTKDSEIKREEKKKAVYKDKKRRDSE